MKRLTSAGLIVLFAAACGGGDSGRGMSSLSGGAIAVSVSGLPAGTGARVTISGPGGSVRTLSGSEIVAGLAAGSYTVSAGYVNASSQTWTPQVSPSAISVVESDTARVAVTYTGGPATTLNLRIAGTQLIQSTQRSDGSVPMIAGRDALLRVFVTANAAETARPRVRVRIFAGGVPVDSVTVAAPASQVPTSVDTASLGASWNVLIPGARVTANLSLQAEVDPDDEVAETDETDNLWPGAAPQNVAVQSVPSLAIRFVPVKQSVNNLTGRVNAANRDSLAETTRRMHPLGATTLSVRSVYVTSAPALVSDDANGGWSQILGEIYALRTSDGFNGEYVGVVPVTYGGGIAGLGYVGAPAAVSWDKSASAPGVIAHELGHNFGRSHAPCGNPSGPDPNYPYPGASIGTWGLDLPALSLKAPGTYKDLMSYCDPDWISDYNYMAILGFRGTGASQQPFTSQGASQDGLMVWGRIRNGTVVLEPSYRVHAPAALPAGGPNRVEGFDVNGGRVFGVSFEGVTVADLPGGEEKHFAFVLPLSGSEISRLATMRLTGRGLTVRQRRTLPAAGGMGPEIIQRRGGPELRWNPAYPLAVVRDAKSGRIISFARGGAVQIPAWASRVTVQLSEGVSSLPETEIGSP